MKIFRWILVAIYGLCSCTSISAGCEFEGLIAECGIKVGGIDLSVRAHINHCSTPIDVTFFVENTELPDVGENGVHEEGSFRAAKSVAQERSTTPTQSRRQQRQRRISWKYTFVTTNQAETREVPGFDSRAGAGRVLLHLLANASEPAAAKVKRSLKAFEGRGWQEQRRVVTIKAQFSVDGQTDPKLAFLDDTVFITHFDDCASLQYQTEVNYIALATIVIVSILGILSLVGLCIYRHKVRANEDQMDLMNNMQQASPTRPYNLTTPEQRSEFHQRQPSIHLDMVHYVVPAAAAATNDASDAGTDKLSRKSDEQDEYGETNDLKLYVSTASGLKKVVNKKSHANRNNEQKKKGSQKLNNSSSSGGGGTAKKAVKFSTNDGDVTTSSVPTNSSQSIPLYDGEELDLPPPPLPRKPQIQDPMASSQKGGFLDTTPEQLAKCSSPTTSESTSSLASSSDRSLGAIPKKRQQSSKHSDSSSNGNKSRKNRHRNDLQQQQQHQYNINNEVGKCRQQSRQPATSGGESSPISSASSSGNSLVSR